MKALAAIFSSLLISAAFAENSSPNTVTEKDTSKPAGEWNHFVLKCQKTVKWEQFGTAVAGHICF